jgi:Zn-dependent protease
VNATIPLGRIRNIAVGIHWSLLLIGLLLATGLASTRFPSDAPGYSHGSYLIAGVVTTILFFAAILAHEISHALVARREGRQVERIVLWLLGGLTEIEGEASTPGEEFRISIAGPAVSLIAGFVFGGAAFLLHAAGVEALAVAVSAWLAIINILLAGFNLIPAAPLDGGRVLHALVWWRRGDRLRATRTSSWAGRALGFAMLALGIVEFAFGSGFGGGLWLAFIGWFLLSAARAEQGQAEVRHQLEGVRVADVMSPNPTVAPGWITAQAFVDGYVLTHQHSAFPVEAWTGGLAGLITLKRIRQVPADQRSLVRVSDVAVPMSHVPIGRPEEPLIELLTRMEMASEGRALVFDGDRLVGIVTPTDVNRAMRRSAFTTDASRAGPPVVFPPG